MIQPWCRLGLRLVLRGHVGPLQHPDSQAHTEKENPAHTENSMEEQTYLLRNSLVLPQFIEVGFCYLQPKEHEQALN